MPQIVLEYSSNIDLTDEMSVLAKIHQILNEVGKINLNNCKSRIIEQSRYLVGNGNPINAFVHLEIAFMEGRSDELKKIIGDEILNYMKTVIIKGVQITVHITDLLRNSYFKHPSGTL
jgi:5-carboxymethyl-2-hydroxymuconate isomerase